MRPAIPTAEALSAQICASFAATFWAWHLLEGQRTVLFERLQLLILLALLSVASLGALGEGLDASIAEELKSSPVTVPALVSQRAAMAASLGRHLVDAQHVSEPPPSGLVLAEQADSFGRIRHAFGDKQNPIQFSMELEGRKAQGIVDLYRPKNVREDDWLSMSLGERLAFVESLGSAPWAWNSWLRLSTAPEWMRSVLQSEAQGRFWEISTQTYSDTLDEMWQQAELLREATGSEAFHYHVSFRPEQRFASELAVYLAHVDEVFTTHMFDVDPVERGMRLANARSVSSESLRDQQLFSSVAHPFLGPQVQSKLDLVARSAGPEVEHAGLKYHSVGYRHGAAPYNDEDRVGFEFRATGPAEKDRAFLELTVEFLESPASVNLAMMPGAPFYIADLKELDRLSPATRARFGDATVSRALSAIAESGNMRGVPDVKYTAIRWAYPLLKWEERPYLRAAASRIKEARRAFTEEVLEIVRAYQAEGKPGDRSYADRMNYAVERFVHDAEIARRH